MSALRISSLRMANSRKSSAAQVVEGHAMKLPQYQGETPIASQESARIWRHQSLEGVELFRGSYKTYQAARHFPWPPNHSGDTR